MGARHGVGMVLATYGGMLSSESLLPYVGIVSDVGDEDIQGLHIRVEGCNGALLM